MFYFKKISIIVLFMILAGCSPSKSHFDCPYGKGVGCKSITEVNRMVNQGAFEKEEPLGLKEAPREVKTTFVSVSPSIVSTDAMVVQRVTEEHLRVWLAPFQDKQGHFHEASIIHTVLRPGFWQVQEGV